MSVLFLIRIQDSLSTNSGVAPSLYPSTGTHKHKHSAVDIQKLSFVMFIVHLAFFIISIIVIGSFRPVKVMFFCASFFISFSSGPLQIIIRG
ncbi:TPA: hypothetical protein DIC40_05260 [Patescibacteria group bacterium]|nr:hypothetical protein [Candidatus Gracilibacteria bacterium]